MTFSSLCMLRLDGFLFSVVGGIETICFDPFCGNLCFFWDWHLRGKDLPSGFDFLEKGCALLSCKCSAAGCRRGS